LSAIPHMQENIFNILAVEVSGEIPL